MPDRFSIGDKVYFIESRWRIREAELKECSGGLALIRFLDGDGGIRIRESRLYKTAKEAEEHTRKVWQQPLYV